MSCDGNRERYFRHLETELGIPGLAGNLIARYYTRSEPLGDARILLARAKTTAFFAEMRQAGFAPPCHSKTGLPRDSACMGYASVYDYLSGLPGRKTTGSNLVVNGQGAFSSAGSTLILALQNRFSGLSPEFGSVPSTNGKKRTIWMNTGREKPPLSDCQQIAADVAARTGTSIEVASGLIRLGKAVFLVQAAKAHKTTRPVDLPGLVKTRKNPLLPGAWVSIYQAAEAGLDPAGGDWVAVCEEHGTLCNFPALSLAQEHLVAVDWCEACQAIQTSKEE